MKRLLDIYLMLICSVFGANITPIPTKIDDVNPQKVSLGKKLFFDTILSVNNTISCLNCHILSQGGDDNRVVSIGVNGKKGSINSPTVLNARYNFVQFWDGRAKNLADQAKGPITNPVEMGNTFANLIKTLNKTHYKEEFKKIYKDGITEDNIVDAIAEYEKTLITPNSPFDRYLRGDKGALTKEQKEGYELFKKEGCISCHNGVNLGSNLYAKFGEFKDAKSQSLGRYDVTKNELDKYFFKVPTLRNIDKTAPYLHDGRYKTLKSVVAFMLEYQLGKKVDDKKVSKIVAFLHSLTGKLLKY